MAKVGELSIEIIINGKKAVAEIKNFDQILKEVTAETQKNANRMKSAFQRVAEMGEKLFFTINGFRALFGPLGQLTNAANDYDAAQRKLAATAKLTGANLDTLRAVSEQTKQTYSLNTIQANELTIALTKLGQKAGDTSQTAEAIGRLLDLAAAQGLNAQQALEAINQAILGIDEGTDKLFQKNPSQIYKEYAAQIGKTAGALTDQEKAQALLNAVLTDGAKVQGEYNKFLESAAGKQAQAAARAQELQAQVGRLINLAYVPLLELATPLLNFFTSLDMATQKMLALTSAFAVAGWKLIPMFNAWNTSIKILGISIKTALGWIGVLVTAASLLYTAWSSNLFGIRDKIDSFLEGIKIKFYKIMMIIKEFGQFLASYLKNVFSFWKNLLSGNFSEAMEAARNAKDALLNNWSDTLARIKGIWEQNAKNIQAIKQKQIKAEEDEQKAVLQIQQNSAQQSVQIEQKKTEALLTLQRLRIANIRNEYQRRLAEVEFHLQQEKAKWAGHAEIITELEKQAFSKIQEINQGFIQSQITAFQQLKTKNLQLLQEELAERKRQIAAYFDALIKKYQGNKEVVTTLQNQKNEALLALDNAMAERQKAITDEVKQYKIQNMNDEFARRRAEVEAWYQEEVEKAQGNAELLAEIERMKQEKLTEIANAEAEARFEHQWGLHQSMLDAMSAGYDTFFNTLLDTEMSAKARREQIWNAMKGAFIRNIQEMLKKYMFVKAKEKLIHVVTEKIKTKTTKTETATRSGISIGALIQEGWQVLKSIGTYIGQIAVKLFSWFASKGPVGVALGLALVPALVMGIRSAVRGLMKFEKGGIAKKEVLALIGEAGDSEAVIPLNQQGANFMAKLIPKIIVPQPNVTAAVQMNQLANEMAEIKQAIRQLKLTTSIDSTELAIVVENGQAQMGNFDF